MPLPDDARPDDASAARAAGGPGAARAAGAQWQVVHVHPSAPLQPAQGAPCNGCGLCCLAEPCPLGMLVSRRRTGPCTALRWRDESVDSLAEMPGGNGAPAVETDPASGRGEGAGRRVPASPGRYVCGMVADPGEVTGWRSAWAAGLMRALARRWIAAGIGCDAPPLRPQPPENGTGGGSGDLL
ncbi:hypothetical protein AVHM3334_07095 [Acidovorax sp. SUPP3334]|nr:hypothetical protein AVHM3334_07095 [Acidovorax sp. SUPP3334]